MHCTKESVEILVRAICQIEGLTCREIQVLRGGQVNQVFLLDGAYVLRIGAREDALPRLRRETELLQSLAGRIPVPKILAFGQHDGAVYQIQQYIPGQKLHSVWKDLTSAAQEAIVAELAAHLKVLHSTPADTFGYAQIYGKPFHAWDAFVFDRFNRTLEGIQALGIRMVPGYIELAQAYLDDQRHVLQDGTPTLVHGDLSLVNLLADHGKLSAILDFEYALNAPADYELWVIEAFCLYPNDYAEEENENYCSADFARFIPLLQKHYPALFGIPHLRQRVNCYHLVNTLDNYLAWRKDNLSTIPPDTTAASRFYMARITNFIHNHGAKMFFT